ncbi:sulfurtransferase TusA family protein [Caldisalinibacter kiritimatiensis]|uniref:SirA-like protein n=1 Tax=Caldisalinibacter kiritimatiensis TaxID=1304284 RepID=R1CB77_9FIRM|nr:sulfurtransferase TusA family protein [Caldisalinibacter kiritimatiensis]EOC99559.1 SirA-like protein [Caldisalinibacter kiritimatiensis]
MGEKKIDCMDEICPMPLLRTIKEIKKIDVGEVLIIETNHNCSIINITEWAEKQGYNSDYMEISEGKWEIYIEKTK